MSGADEVTRVAPDYLAGERQILTEFLDYHRQTLALKCEGLDADALARRSLPPSTLSLLGLVRHMAEVEAWWLRSFAGEQFGSIYCTDDDPDADFHGAVADDSVVAHAFTAWRAEIAYADEVIARAGLDDTYWRDRKGGQTISLRWILVHLVEEYARHNGHADLLREAIDGTVGE